MEQLSDWSQEAAGCASLSILGWISLLCFITTLESKKGLQGDCKSGHNLHLRAFVILDFLNKLYGGIIVSFIGPFCLY